MSSNLIKNKRQAKKAGLGVFYQRMMEFLAQNETHELTGISLGIKDKPTLSLFVNDVSVGIQSDFIRAKGVERLPKGWNMICADESAGAQLLEVWYKRDQISDNK